MSNMTTNHKKVSNVRLNTIFMGISIKYKPNSQNIVNKEEKS